MRFLVDNMVPRSVTLALRQSGHKAVEVRAVLGANADDGAIAAYAAAQGLMVITHDAGLADRCRARRVAHVLLRVPEILDRDRVVDVLLDLDVRLGYGSLRAVVHRRTLRFV